MESLRPVLRWIAVLTLVALAVYLSTGRHGGPPTGVAAPDIQGRLLAGGADFRLADHRGRTLVLDFWATWCPPCQRTLPALQRLHKQYAGSDVHIVSVNTDQGPDREKLVGDFLKRRGYDFPVLLDDGRISQDYQVRSIPLLVIVRPDGVVEEAHVGLLDGDPERLVRALAEKIEAARKLAPGA